MGDRIIAHAGKLLVHAVKALLVCWQRMLRLGLSVGALSGFVALVFGAYVTHAFPPAPLTWVAALFFGFALGYAAAMTVLADEMLLSIIEAVGVLEGDVRAGMRAAAVAAEREAGEAGHGIMRFLGHPRTELEKPAPTPAPVPDRAPPSAPLMTVSSMGRHEPGHEQASETLAAIAATESFINTAPHPAVNAQPVRADQLPRIGWAATDEGDTRRVPPQAVAAPAAVALPALAEMPPLPMRPLRSQPRAELARDAETQAVQAVRHDDATDAHLEVQSPAPASAVGASGWTPASSQDDTLDTIGAPLAAPAVVPAEEPPAVQDGATQPDSSNAAMAAVAPPKSVPVLTREAGSDVPDGTGATESLAAGGDTATTFERPRAAITRPIEPDREEHGIWARISHALIGNTTVPLREVNAAGNAGDGPSETSQP